MKMICNNYTIFQLYNKKYVNLFFYYILILKMFIFTYFYMIMWLFHYANVTRTPAEYTTQLPAEVPVDIHNVTVPEDIVLAFALESPLFKI